jgi:homoserine/homoserine lactone efflux protein
MSSASVFQAFKWAGAAYLVFIGLKMLLAKRSTANPDLSIEAKPSMRLFSEGLVTQLSNAKAIVFFSALLPQFLSPDGGVVKQFAILGIVSLVVEFGVLMAYGWAAERGGRFILKGKFSVLTDRIAGGFLIGAGLGLAAARRF